MAAIIALLAAEEQRVRTMLTDAGATSPRGAIEFGAIPAELQRRARDLAANGALQTTADGRYWVDATVLAARDAKGKRIAWVIIAVALAAVALVFVVNAARRA